MSSNSFFQDIQYLLEAQQYSSLLLENRIQFLKDKNPTIDTSHDTLAIHHSPSDIIDHFAEVGDPSKNKQHTQWILGQYKKKNIRQEDMYRVRPALENFDKYKSKLDKKDINQYKTLSELETAVRPHIGTASTKKEEIQQNITKGHTLIHEGKDGTKVYRLEPTEEGKNASISIYGGGGDLGGTHTSWCTAADSEYNMFKHYSKDQPLHTIHTKDGEVYQAHPITDQLMDRHDEEVIGMYEDHNGDLVAHKHANEISSALDHIPNGGVLKISKELPNVSHKDIDSIISQPPEKLDHKNFRLAVLHPNITPELLEKAYYNHDFYSKQEVLRNPKTPVSVVKHGIEKSNHWGVKYVAMSSPSLSEDDIRKYFVGQSDNDLKGALLQNPNVPKNLLKDAIDFGSNSEIKHALKSSRADADILRYGVEKHPHQVYNALENPNATPDIIDKGLNDGGWGNQYGQQMAAEHPNANAENLHKALKSKISSVRAAVVAHPNFNESHLKIALNDDDPYVIGKALKHPLVNSEHLHHMLMNNEIHPMIANEFYIHKKLSQKDLDYVLNSNNKNAVVYAMQNKNTPLDKIKELSQHNDSYIREHAKYELRKRESKNV